MFQAYFIQSLLFIPGFLRFPTVCWKTFTHIATKSTSDRLKRISHKKVSFTQPKHDSVTLGQSLINSKGNLSLELRFNS